jgi:hypothetical protein
MLDALGHSLQITAFVAVMMIAVEYLNIVSRGASRIILTSGRGVQYVVGALLGAVPGCLGPFAMVALYSHRVVSLGALTACMVATSGDETFVMLALFPGNALLLMSGLTVLGVVAGIGTDLVLKPAPRQPADHDLVYHAEETCQCFPRGRIIQQWREPSAARGILCTALAIFCLSLSSGWLGPTEWNWVRWTLLGTAAFGLFIVLTVPDHFLDEHLWRHIALQHVPRIFAWTFGALLVISGLRMLPALAPVGGSGQWPMLAAAALLGIVPESGPHLLFVTLYDEGLVPMSTLVASSIVQDGHGMLPLLAYSRPAFLKVKGINLVIGLLVGFLMMALGW